MDGAKQGRIVPWKILILSQIVRCILDIRSGPDRTRPIDRGPTELLPSAKVKMETVAHVKGREAAEAGNAQGLIALPAGLRGCAPTVTLDGAQGQLLISVAAFATDFLDDVGAHLHKKTKHAYITTIPISPYLAWATFCSSNKILIDSTEAVQSFLGPHWHCKTFGKGSTARSIKPLHLTWLPAKQQLHIKFNCAIYNGQGMLQTDGRKYSLPTLFQCKTTGQDLILTIIVYQAPLGGAVLPLATIAATAATCGAS